VVLRGAALQHAALRRDLGLESRLAPGRRASPHALDRPRSASPPHALSTLGEALRRFARHRSAPHALDIVRCVAAPLASRSPRAALLRPPHRLFRPCVALQQHGGRGASLRFGARNGRSALL